MLVHLESKMEPLTIKLILIPIIGFIIGLTTNYIAIKMLFFPKKPILGFQGILPKRKPDLAKKISEVSPELMPLTLQKIEKIPKIGPKIMQAFKHAIENQVNSLSTEQLEKIILKVVKKELNFVVWIGGIIGFLIGLIQVLILTI